MQLMEKSGIYLSYGVTGKVGWNIPELCCAIPSHAVYGKVRNILMSYCVPGKVVRNIPELCYSIPCSSWKSQEYT
jgi:hypothetical protein